MTGRDGEDVHVMGEDNRRALVLGGGGMLGVGWLAGLAHGVRDAGRDLVDGRAVFGTSAGAFAGAMLAVGRDPLAALPEPHLMAPVIGHAGGADLFAALASLQLDNDRERMMAVGKLAGEADTVDEEAFLSLFVALGNQAWPSDFRCAITDVDTGRITVLDDAAGAPLQRAVAASCSVPLAFPPVTVGGRQYIDGGLVSHINGQLAAGYRSVVVISCFPVETHVERVEPELRRAASLARAEVSALRTDSSDVLLVEPSRAMVDLSDGGRRMMDTDLLGTAYEAGVDQGRELAHRLPVDGPDV